MKIVAFISSGRKNGNTARLVQLLEVKLKAEGERRHILTELKIIDLAEANLGVCRGCRLCFDKGEEQCPLKDDLLVLRSEIKNADCTILASPVYVEDVNGVMKNFIDRLAFVCHRPEFAGKSAYVLTTSGSGSSGHALRTMSMALRVWGFFVVGQSKFTAGALMRKEEMDRLYQKRLEEIAARIFHTMSGGKVNKPSLFALMVFGVQQRLMQKITMEKKDTYDYKYWSDRGWLNRRRDYYTEHHASIVKVKIARLLGRAIGWFMK